MAHATEAAAACRDLARDRFSVDRLVAIIDPANRPSRAVAENIRLRYEKHWRAARTTQFSRSRR